MNRVDCENCKNYFNWSDVSVLPDKNGLFVKKIVLNEVCCKVNKEIKNIKRCNSYEEAETKKEEVVEEKIEEIKPEPKIEEPKKEIRKIAEGRRKKR